MNILKLIQIGFCLCDEKGNVPEKGLIWQFNFKFDLKYHKILISRDEEYHPDAISLLKESGINFEKLNSHGCDHMKFAELMISSGD